MFKVNYSEVKTTDYAPLPEGEYEIVISEVEIKDVASTGEKKIALTLTIRDDVDQVGQKRKVWDDILFRDTMKWKFQQVAKAIQVADGKEFATIEDFARELQFKTARVKVVKEEYKDKMYDRVKVWSVSQAKAPGPQATANPFEATGAPAPASKDDLPF
jgi:hypothetical protein